MPIHKVSGGWKWGDHGKVYPTRKDAEKQAEAAYANGYKGDSKDEAIGAWTPLSEYIKQLKSIGDSLPKRR